MLTDWIARAAVRHPDRAAIVWGPIRIPWSELPRRVDQCASGLAASGVAEGDTVALVVPNRPEFVIAFFAAMRIGAIMVPAAPAQAEAELNRLLADAAPKLLICDGPRLDVCTSVARQLADVPRLVVVGDAAGQPDREARAFDAFGAGAPAAPVRGTSDSRALYLYTSGSTDSFKRVCCTRSNLHFEAENFVSSTRQTANDTIFCAVPLCHSYGMGNGLLDAAYAGATLVLEDDTDAPFVARARSVLDRLRSEAVRVFLGVPYQY
jgi:long-chain acyl-CoA synthetase